MEAILSLDGAILRFFQESVRVGVLNTFFSVLTGLADHGMICIAVCLVLIAVKKTRYKGVTVFCCLALAYLLNNILLKNLIDRPRPYVVFQWLQTVGSIPSDSSFPSGHACACFATAYGVWQSFRGRTWWVFIPAALIAVGRVYEGIHYPTDVIAGVVMGLACAMLAYRLRVRFLRFPRTEDAHPRT